MRGVPAGRPTVNRANTYTFSKVRKVIPIFLYPVLDVALICREMSHLHLGGVTCCKSLVEEPTLKKGGSSGLSGQMTSQPFDKQDKCPYSPCRLLPKDKHAIFPMQLAQGHAG